MATSLGTFPQIQSRPEFAGILKQQETFSTGNAEDPGEEINSWFDKLCMQSGAEIAPSMLVFLSLCFAVTFGGVMFVIQENLLSTAILAIIGFFIPVVILLTMRARRQTLIVGQMPLLADGLARAARTGRSMEQCLHFVAEEVPSPLGDELKLSSGRLAMGLPVNRALNELPERTGVNSLRILTTALTVHQQTGGDIAKVMERMATTLRDRSQFLGRLQASTAASRATAVLMMVIPPLVFIFFMIRDPNYFNSLTSSKFGLYSLVIATILQVIGAIWVLSILQNSKRT